MPDTRTIAGAMSGTSADGVDIALCAITGRGLDMSARLIHHHHRPYNTELRNAIFAFRGDRSLGGEVASASSTDYLAKLAQLGREISLTYATAVNEALAAAHMSATQLSAVAAHGQTLYHGPPNTIQWFDPSLVAAEVGCPVVSDFRRADLAAGEQAPLVVFADYILFRHPTKNRLLLNIGGIANITSVPSGATIDQITAFDTGPGNCISDWICRMHGPFGLIWDVDGAGTSRGRVVEEISQSFMSDPYFSQPPPKSTDGPTMTAIFERAGTSTDRLAMNDLLATATHLTALSVARAVATLSPLPHEIIATGGGIHNKSIMGWLRSLIDPIELRIGVECGVPGDAKEALAFALLAAATLDGVPSNVPSATGAKRAVVLGSITPKP